MPDMHEIENYIHVYGVETYIEMIDHAEITGIDPFYSFRTEIVSTNTDAEAA